MYVHITIPQSEVERLSCSKDKNLLRCLIEGRYVCFQSIYLGKLNKSNTCLDTSVLKWPKLRLIFVDFFSGQK